MHGPRATTSCHRGIRRLLLSIPLLIAGACASPEPPPLAAPAAKGTPSASAVQVTLTPSKQGVRATFVLDAPAQQLFFAEVVTARRDAWQSITEGVELVGDALRSASPRSTFDVLIEPDTQQYDRVYPSLTRIGEGFVLYGPALALRDLQTSVRVAPGAGRNASSLADALEGYVYVGPTVDRAQGPAFALIGADTVAPWLAETIITAADESLGWYASVLGRSMRRPILFVAGDAPGPTRFHGDVTDNAVIFLRFHGGEWDDPDEAAGRSVATFVRHEAFHLWNGRNAEGTPPWLHEGGAEYAALVGAAQAGVLTQDDALDQVAARVAKCRRKLGERPISQIPSKGSTVYDCGVALQWLADVEARHTSDGARNTFTLWRALLAAADAHGGYTVADFRELTGPLVALLLDEQPEGRWTQLQEILAEYGATVSETPSAADYRSAAVGHLLQEQCGDAPRGYWTESHSLRLDTKDRCGALCGDPVIVGIEGHDLFEDPKAAFEATAARCTQGQAVRLNRRSGVPLSVPCESVPRLPPTFSIERAPELAIGVADAPAELP